jgi:iron complex outermembrane receptor protein
MGLPVPIDLGGTVNSKSYAIFSSGTLDISDAAQLYAGVRYTKDRKSIDEFNNFIGAGKQSANWGKATYEIGGSYKFSDTVNAYAKFSTGYKGGGFSTGALTPKFAPETNANMEVGLKGRFLENTLQANIAAFHMTYDDLQVNQVIGVVASVTNAAKAKVNGIEAELIILPTKNFRLELSGALLDAQFQKFKSFDSSRPALGTLDLSGNHLPNAPKASFSAGGYYSVLTTNGDLTLGARYDWSTTRYFTEFNIPISSQPTSGKLDLSVNWKSVDGLWNAGIHARNILNASRLSSVTIVSALLGSLAIGQYEPGRQIGLSVGHRF